MIMPADQNLFAVKISDFFPAFLTEDMVFVAFVNPIFLYAFASLASILVALRFIMNKINFTPGLEIDALEIGIGNGKLSLKPNNTDRQIAYKIWVELCTRKLGLPIDFDNDVISEIYDSWYSFFSVARELLKEIPVSKIQRKDTLAIIELSIKVLNIGLRPHLTQWQARFRHWYEKEKEKNKGNSPQELQAMFPDYDELIKDMEIVNRRLIAYKETMYKVIKNS